MNLNIYFQKIELMPSTKNVGMKFSICLFWFLVKYFTRNCFSMHYVYTYLISCFHRHCSHFIVYICHYALCSIKQIHKKCDKNISRKKYEQLGNLFKMKEFIKWLKLNYSWKRAFCLNKRATFLTKEHLEIKKGRWRSYTPLIGSCFWYFWFKFRKTFFFQSGHFVTKHPIPGCFIFLK